MQEPEPPGGHWRLEDTWPLVTALARGELAEAAAAELLERTVRSRKGALQDDYFLVLALVLVFLALTLGSSASVKRIS